jgi:hypothetical protein
MQQAMVKVGPTSPPPKRVAGRKDKPTNSDLPRGTLDNNAWRGRFISTYQRYLAGRVTDEAWGLEDDEAVSLMQKIWNYIYGARVPNRIVTGEPTFVIVSTPCPAILCA